MIGAAAGAVAGLVAITPASGYVDVPAAILIGLGAGIICYLGRSSSTQRFEVDDALDVFGVHGVGGIWGALATGLFAQTAVNPAGADGLSTAIPSQLRDADRGRGAVTWVFSAAVTLIILKLIDLTIGLRVPEQEEVLGLDTTPHGEIAYQL